MPVKKSYGDALEMICDNERDFIDLVVSTLYSQHAQERYILKKMTSSVDDTEGVMKSYFKTLKTDLVGSTQVLFVLMEMYRVLVERGKIKPVEATVVASRIGLCPSDAQKMLKVCRESIKEDMGDLLDKKELFTIDGINTPDESPEEEKVANDVESLLKAAFEDAKKQVKKEDKDDAK